MEVRVVEVVMIEKMPHAYLATWVISAQPLGSHQSAVSDVCDSIVLQLLSW